MANFHGAAASTFKGDTRYREIIGNPKALKSNILPKRMGESPIKPFQDNARKRAIAKVLGSHG